MDNKIVELTPVFCHTIPAEIEPGKIYISEEYGTATHLCACGCNEKTVTPLAPDEWTLTKNEEKITLRPSIGNFTGEVLYHAHYYITNNKIEWL